MMRVYNMIDPSYSDLGDRYPDWDVVVLNDVSAVLADKYRKSIAWLNESPDIIEWQWRSLIDSKKSFHETLVENLETGKHTFKTLYTFDKRYANLPNVKMVPPAIPSWVHGDECGVYEKTKTVNCVTSSKTHTPLQSKRVVFARKLYEKNIPVIGRGWTDIPFEKNKAETLKEFRYSFVIENGVYRGYHTEKILDCFRTGTVPIYMGDPDIGDYYNTDGILLMEDLDMNIDDLISSLTEERYNKMIPAIQENYDIALTRQFLGEDVMDIIHEHYYGR